ncbi:hypothetical protein CDL15_Pgr020659 [Punica granatum]|uniref:Uncharacterized protein n=1 Tax=Punica granatum TaxID=22663 RepID=A0A218VTE5_PUNGR|nr:hypothetical protein CDL15_Pgr020659 [Punica granatum]
MLGWSPKAVNAGPEPDAVNAGPKPDAGPKPNAGNAGPKPNTGNAGPEPDAGPKPNTVNVGPEPDAGPKPNAVNACSIGMCKKCESKDRVDPGLFSENDHHSHLQRAVRVDPITLGPNDHHSHLRGSVRSQEPLTLPQNSIGSLRGDVRPDWCQTGPNFQTYSVFRDLCRAVRVDPITLGPNDHHSHLRGSVRSQEPLTLPQNSIGSLRGDVRPDWCQTGPNFQTYSVFRDLCRAVRVDPITLGPNDHHSHLRGSVRSQEPLTLPQNSIGSLRGDVRPDLCQSGLSNISAGSV